MKTSDSTSPALETPELKRSLGTFDGTALLLGITIGSGIYSTPSLIAQSFHSYGGVIATWIVVGAFVMIGGLIYSELGTRLPETGGEYIYITRCFGPMAGFLFGWAQLFIIRTSPAAGLAIIASDYVAFFLPLSQGGRTLTAISILIAIGVFNYLGVEMATRFQNVTTIIKVGGLILFALVFAVLLGPLTDTGQASQLGSRASQVPSPTFLGNLIPALMLIVFTHTGWDRVGYVAGEMRDPVKTIPRSMLFGMSIVLVIYWTVVTIYHSALGMEGLRATTTPAADVATLMIGPLGASVIAALAIVSAIGSINGTTLSATRVYYAMAHDRLFFRAFDFIHPRFRTPSRAIIAHIVWAIAILLLRGSFANIAAGMVFAILIFYTMTTLALFKLRKNNVGGDNAYRMPLYPWLPALYLIGIVGLLGFRAVYEWRASLIDLTFLASGLPASLFWLARTKKS